MEIRPLIGLGQFKFGDDKVDIRKRISSRLKELETKDKHSTDFYPELSLFFAYDQNDKCEAIQAAPPNKLLYNKTDLMKLNYHEALSLLSRDDDKIKEDNDGFTSFKLGIGSYAPGKIEQIDAPIEGIIVFKKGYYED